MLIEEVDTSFNNPFLPPIEVGQVERAKAWRGLTYSQVRGYRAMVLDLYVPDGAERPVPAVVYVHGGSFTAGDRRYLPNNWPAQSIFQMAVDAGMAIATIDYRHLAEAGGLAQVQDVAAAIRYLKHFAQTLGLDANRLGLWGESAGATLAALAHFVSGTQNEQLLTGGVTGVDATVRGAVIYYPPTDLVRLAKDANMHGNLRQATKIDVEMMTKSSPINYVHAGIGPTLLVHGEQDLVVPFEQSQLLLEKLVACGIAAELWAVRDADHCFVGVDPMPILTDTINWLKRLLTADE